MDITWNDLMGLWYVQRAIEVAAVGPHTLRLIVGNAEDAHILAAISQQDLGLEIEVVWTCPCGNLGMVRGEQCCCSPEEMRRYLRTRPYSGAQMYVRCDWPAADVLQVRGGRGDSLDRVIERVQVAREVRKTVTQLHKDAAVVLREACGPNSIIDSNVGYYAVVAIATSIAALRTEVATGQPVAIMPVDIAEALQYRPPRMAAGGHRDSDLSEQLNRIAVALEQLEGR